MAIEGTVHQAGALKQTNKTHKHGKHRSNRQIDTENKGKRKIFNLAQVQEINFCIQLHRTSVGKSVNEI